MNNISLIANTGVQFYKTRIEINPNDDVVRSLRFCEVFDEETYRSSLGLVYYLSEQDVWLSLQSLREEGYVTEEKGKIKVDENLNLNILQIIDPDPENGNGFSVNDIETPLEKIEDQWVTLPFFERGADGKTLFGYGANNWCKLKLTLVEKKGATLHRSSNCRCEGSCPTPTAHLRIATQKRKGRQKPPRD